ncbi:MAG: hypothetical protein K0S74_1669 [Chlamydiales bacterium]|jgi:hypothetical protein|nr:hypothetical protein [Chlamydiales bacterium]
MPVEIAKKTLYNLLRLHSAEDKLANVEPWQILDYRQLNFSDLFEKLKALDIHLDKASFLIYAENYDAPEELAEDLLAETDDIVIHDKVYLLIFELWRRFVPSKRSISVFCDEIDYRIHQYDLGKFHADESICEILYELKVILDSSAESGEDLYKIFEIICSHCANDLESFLYDFLSELLDQGLTETVIELLGYFSRYVLDIKWFEFLTARTLAVTDFDEARPYLQSIIDRDPQEEGLLELILELLYFLIQQGDQPLFIKGVKKVIPLLTEEGELRELIDICIQYCDYLEFKQKKLSLINLLNQRMQSMKDLTTLTTNADKEQVLKILL